MNERTERLIILAAATVLAVLAIIRIWWMETHQ